MKPDDLGFFYPEVNSTLCTDCGACNTVCAFQNGYNAENNLNTPLVFAARHKNMQEIETSRSGAMFIAVSDYVLEKDGIVYGVGYSEHFRVVHKRAITKEGRDEFKGSKYVQSDLSDIFPLIKQDLIRGYTVLFSGTPCQTAGLASFLRKIDKTNLILVDIVCHGVPSPYVWNDYLKYIEKKNKDIVEKVDFRDKLLGWNTHFESFTFKNRRKIIKQTYSDLFGKCIMFRSSCGNCKYTNTIRPSDITIADYWGWEKLDAEFNKDNKGCSLVFVNTKKGESIWDDVKDQVNYLPSDLSRCLQPNLQAPSILSKDAANFKELYIKKGFLAVAKRYGNLGWNYKINKIKLFIKRLIKKVIR
jgi:coenzyme F420-reducing hydrogenase beta subunit